MSTVTTVPGIYIEEDASPAISVSQGATAVPLFIGRFSPLNSDNNHTLIRVSSWLDFNQKFSVTSGVGASVEITSKPDDAANPTKYTYTIASSSLNVAIQALQLYFQNGGNACYVFALADTKDDNTLTALPDQIDAAGEITLFVVPDNDADYQKAVYGALSASLDQNKGYFLLADSPDGKKPSGISSSSHIAVYYPPLSVLSAALQDADVSITGYKDIKNNSVSSLKDLKTVNAELAVKVSDALAELPELTVPASALMAGVYCKTDSQRGVWKAPANVVLNGVSDVSVRVTDDTQGGMNTNGVNVIRNFSDRGIVVWGARTLQDDDNWRYIPVRRLFDAAERDIKKALRPMVFEPNSQLTWKRVQAAIDHYLYSLWQQGGLAGNKADEAYFVRIGKDITMTTDDINQGKMIVQVGMAAVRPAEFIILQFTQDMTQ